MIRGNAIGTSATGAPLGNGGDGVYAAGSGNTIGAADPKTEVFDNGAAGDLNVSFSRGVATVDPRGDPVAADLLSRASFGGLPLPLDPRGVRAILGPAGGEAHAQRYTNALARGWPDPDATALIPRLVIPAL